MQERKFIVIVPSLRGKDPAIRVNWCRENVGIRYVDWDTVMSAPEVSTLSTFRFAREQDAIFFSLRWAGVEV